MRVLEAEGLVKSYEVIEEKQADDGAWQVAAALEFQKANGLARFITGQMYSRQKLPHPTRQLVTVAALTALNRTEELRLHIWAALNVGCSAEEIAEFGAVRVDESGRVVEFREKPATDEARAGMEASPSCP